MFEKLNVPIEWKNSFTKYPHGFTIFEAICEWSKQVDIMIDHLNLTDIQIAKLFTDTLPENVEKVLNDWYATGQLADLINIAVFESVEDRAAQYAKSIKLFPLIIPEADDSGRFQRAVNSGYNIILEKGAEYIIKNMPVNKKDFTLFGNSAKIKTNSKTHSAFIISSTSENVILRDMSLESLADGSSNSSCGIVIDVSGVTAKRNQSAKNIKILNCKFLGGFVTSIQANGVTGLEIADCFSTRNVYTPYVSAGGYFALLQTCYDVLITRNKVVATSSDKHAVYVSANGNLSGSQVNEDIKIVDNDFDWRGVSTTDLFGQVCLYNRSSDNLLIANNRIQGGYSGIMFSPSNADFNNVDILNNIITDVINAPAGSANGIATMEDVYKVKNLRIIGNTVQSSKLKITGISINSTIGFIAKDNIITFDNIAISANRGMQIFNSSDGQISTNKIKGNANCVSGIFLAGNLDKIVIEPNNIIDFPMKEENQAALVATNIKHTYPRSAIITSDGFGTISISGDKDNILSTVTTHTVGAEVRFSKSTIAKLGMAYCTQLGDGYAARLLFYSHGLYVAGNILTLGIASLDRTTFKPLVTTAVSFEIKIFE